MSEPEAVDAAELRSLQARVYARGAEPSQAELDRLAQLQSRVRRSRMVEAAMQDTAPDAAQDTSLDVAEEPTGDGGAAASTPQLSETESPAAPEPEPQTVVTEPRRSRLRLVLIGAALLLAGVLIGAVIPYILEGGSTLTVEQLERRAEIAESAGLDAGSLAVVGEQEGVRVWVATLGDGEHVCVVLDTHDDRDLACIREEMISETGGLHVAQRPRGSWVDIDRAERIEATLYRTIDGEWVAQVHRYPGSMASPFDLLLQFDEEVRPFAQSLVDDGFDPMSLQIVGEFQGRLVWFAARPFPSEQCLIISGGDSQCHVGPPVRESGQLRIVTVIETPGPSVVQEITLNYSNWGWPYLSVRTLGAVDPPGFRVD